MLFGTGIVMDDVKADPRYAGKTPTLKDLADFTMEKKSLYEEEALKHVNGMKSEYGTGASSLVMIYNATGANLKLKPQKDITHNWSGHIWKYPADDTIMNGQWCVFLHVHTSGAARGSVAAIIHTLEGQNKDSLMSWSTPWNQAGSHNKIYAEVRENDHWPGAVSWDLMHKLLDRSGQTCSDTKDDFKISGLMGDNSSPLAVFIVTRAR